MPLDAPQAAQEARLGRARTRSIYICTPIARHPARQFANSLAQTLLLMAQLGIPAFVRQVSGNSNLPRARNELVAEFLATDYTDLLFIDDDMGWKANDVLRLLASDKPIIAGVGAKKRMLPDADPGKWCVRIPPGPLALDDMGAIRVEAVGTGFVKIERQVFTRLIEAHPEWKRNGWAKMTADVKAWYYRFFRFDADHPDEPGEDFDFCWAWNAIGGQVWIDPAINLVHVGEHEFGGDFGAMLEADHTRRDTPCAS